MLVIGNGSNGLHDDDAFDINTYARILIAIDDDRAQCTVPAC